MSDLDRIQRLAENFMWIAPVGNGVKYFAGEDKPRPDLRGFMVCQRSINNPERSNTRVFFLLVKESPYSGWWKYPFKEMRCTFPSLSEALEAAEKRL